MEIPREISAAEVDRPKMAPGEAASGETAVAAFGAEMEQTSFYGARQELVLQGAQDRVDASYAEAKIQERFEQEAEKYRLGLKGDYRNYAKQALLDRDAIQKEIQEDPILKNNPRLQSIIAPHFEHYAGHFQGVINTKYAVDLQQDGYVKHDHKIKELGQQASMIPAGPGRDAIFKEMDAVSNDFVKSNLLNPVHANLLVENEKKNVQEGYLLNLGKSNNPIDIQKAIDLAESKSSTDTDNIDPKSLAQMAGEFRSHLEVVKNKVDNETAMNTALGLMKNHHGDPSLALTELDSNTDMQKAMGANTYQKTRQLLRDHIEDTKEQQEHESGNISKDIMDKVKSGKLGEALHALDQNRDKMTKSDYEVMSNAITSEKKYLRMERREVDRDAREKRRDKGDEIFGTLMTDLMSGKKLNSVHDIYSQVPKGLSAEHANMLAAINDGKKDADFKLGTDVINDAFNNKILDATQRGKAMIDLQARQAKENLSGKALIDAANEIVHPHVEHWYNNLLDKVAGQGTKENQPAPIKSKSGKDMWKWPDGSFHYSPPPEKQ